MEGHIKVNAQSLLTQADEVASLISEVRDRFSSLKTAVDRTNSYWIGEAGNAHRQKYFSSQDQIDEAIRRLNENVTDLRTMAGVYEQAEAQAMSEAEKLIESVIE